MVQEQEPSLEENPSVQYGKFLAHPPPGEEVVISGMAGAFPKADNIDEFKYNLDNKIEMVSEIPKTHPEMPEGFGKLKDGSRFDTGFFGIHKKHAVTLSPMCKLLLEKSYECIFDAGLHPSDLEGTNTGVFLGICCTETDIHWYFKEHVKGGNIILGNLKAAFTNCLSYQLKLKGPSFTIDTACSSSAYALDAAFRAIRTGECDAALVAGVNLVCAGGYSLQFARLGVLSPEGHCRPFDEDGNGYVRAEAVVAVLLQKAKDSHRIYARLVHSKTNCDGYKEQGITYPSGEAQYNLLKEMYLESGINPIEMSYIEAHGTGTIVGDPEEMNSIDAFFTPGRRSPLLVGSVKSSIGHSEPVAALCSIVKVLLAFETNIISPNINYKSPRKTIPGILQGRIEIVVENTPFRDRNGLAGISSFGFGGGNAHVIAKRFDKVKSERSPTDSCPRLVCVSGRTEEAVNVLLDDVADKFDAEHIALIHNAFRKDIRGHLFRGYTIVSGKGTLKKSVKAVNMCQPNLTIFFGGPSKVSTVFLYGLLDMPLLSSLNNRLAEFFTSKKMNLRTTLSSSLHSSPTQLLVDLLGQLTLTELLKQLEVKATTILDHSFGKLTSAYFKNSLSLNEILECIYAITKVSNETQVSKNTYGFTNGAFVKHKSKLLTEFRKILSRHNHVNGYDGIHVRTSAPEYYLEAICDNNRFNVSLPKNSIVLEVGQSLKGQKWNRFSTVISSKFDSIDGVLDILGSLYETGSQPQIQKLYPQVEFPVSRGTPMISSKIKWKHDFKHFVPSLDSSLDLKDAMVFKVSLKEEEWASMAGHVIDGRNLFPATGYLFLAWTLLAEMLSTTVNNLKVMFENCKFVRASSLPKPDVERTLDFHVMLQNQSGNFEITEGGTPVVTGTIKAEYSQRYMETLPITDDCFEEKLNSKDIYKELRLRGYNYKGLFRSLNECNKAATWGQIEWKDNWVAFMDNMLQLRILGEDTRLLYVPTSIDKLNIDPNKHLELIAAEQQGDETKPVHIPVQIGYESGIIRSGGIEIGGLISSSIPRKKTTAFPVLEKYQFIPNEGKLTLEESVRVFMQIALENNCGLKVKAAELIDEETPDNSQPLGPIVKEALEDQPLIQTDITVLTSKEMDLPVNVENKPLTQETECTVVIGNRFLRRKMVLRKAMDAAQETGFLISREPLSEEFPELSVSNLDLLSISESQTEKLVFLRKRATNSDGRPRVFVNITGKRERLEWIDELKDAIKKDQDVIAWCQNEPQNGILGFVNCIRREPDCQNVRCLFIVDDAPDFLSNSGFYKTQLDKNMAINIYMNGRWGTYRHLLLDDVEIESEHCFANSTVRGDLSSIKWIEGPLSRASPLNKSESLVEVYYAALNFRDVMTASGRINVDVITRDRREQDCVQGIEFSGKTSRGRRIMGMLSKGTLATLVKADDALLWDVPDSWSLKEAATVPVVYGTCLYALIIVAKIKPSHTVLIHSGTGGIGQAAINICVHMGCTIFTTVGTEEKRNFIKQHFPQINEKHIGNSRDTSFEQMIMAETGGKGVDIILNSLSDEKLLASQRCLARNGIFLEIGKFDLSNNNRMPLLPFKDGSSYHGVQLDKFFSQNHLKGDLNQLMQRFIDSGAVKPLNTTIFDKNEVEQAFRYMTTGKHTGKVLVEIRKEEVSNHDRLFKSIPRYFCDPSKTYIICGGLGGFGLELADWLILRGARNLVLTSRNGVKTGYQRYRISIWESYSCIIKISIQDITTKSGCETLLKEANSLAPVVGIFNLAVVLSDAIFLNQNEETFNISLGPKACATQNLDEASRTMCPELRDFVVFSSVSCGRGNAGQTNYGMSNSIMERICEKRLREGYPALAIQWGAIGDVGLVAEMQEEHKVLEIGGTLQQSISNCLQVMDLLMRQKNAAIVSSIVVAEKKSSSLSGNVAEVVCGILGIRDIKAVSLNSTLAELGMDSMTGVEVKQTLEREFNIFLSPTEIRSITLVRIQEMLEEGHAPSNTQADESLINWTNMLKDLLINEDRNDQIVKLRTLNTTKDQKTLPRVIALPGIEGVCEMVQNLTEMLEVEAFGVNYISITHQDSIPKMADILLPHIKELLQQNQPFHILAHSMGTTVALEIVSRLEKLGYLGTITCIDGSVAFIKELLKLEANEGTSDSSLENMLMTRILKSQLNDVETEQVMKKIHTCTTVDEKLQLAISSVKDYERFPVSFLINKATATMKFMKANRDYNPDVGKLKSKAFLFKASYFSVKMATDDFELSQYFDKPVEIKVLDGTHTTILQSQELAKIVMENILSYTTSAKD